MYEIFLIIDEEHHNDLVPCIERIDPKRFHFLLSTVLHCDGIHLSYYMFTYYLHKNTVIASSSEKKKMMADSTIDAPHKSKL